MCIRNLQEEFHPLQGSISSYRAHIYTHVIVKRESYIFLRDGELSRFWWTYILTNIL